MRLIITLSKKQLKELKLLEQNKNISRDKLIHNAIDAYIEEKCSIKNIPDVFGLWKNRKINALEYEDHIRADF
jgi:hypothetical protein